jgi:DNA-binding transcriptional ArsR family regulator
MPDVEQPISPEDRQPWRAIALKAAASPRRQEILRMVWNEERTSGEIHRAMPDVTFGAVSQQLKWLLETGLVEARAEKRFHYYRARREAFGPMGEVLERMWDDALWRLKLAAELEQSRRGPKPAASAQGNIERPY